MKIKCKKLLPTTVYLVSIFRVDAQFYICLVLQIVRRYDILLVQEIRDRSQTAIDTLVNAVNTQIG